MHRWNWLSGRHEATTTPKLKAQKPERKMSKELKFDKFLPFVGANAFKEMTKFCELNCQRSQLLFVLIWFVYKQSWDICGSLSWQLECDVATGFYDLEKQDGWRWKFSRSRFLRMTMKCVPGEKKSPKMVANVWNCLSLEMLHRIKHFGKVILHFSNEFRALVVNSNWVTSEHMGTILKFLTKLGHCEGQNGSKRSLKHLWHHLMLLRVVFKVCVCC